MSFVFKLDRVPEAVSAADARSGITEVVRRSTWLAWLLLLLAGCRTPFALSPSEFAVGELSTGEFGESKVEASAFVATTAGDTLSQALRAFTDAESVLSKADPNATQKFLAASLLSLQASEMPDSDQSLRDRAAILYHSSVGRLIESAQQFGQLDGRAGIVLATSNGSVEIPIRYHGFAWGPEDFNQWIPVGEYKHDRLSRKHVRAGWGVPMVVLRERDYDEPLVVPKMPFAATVLIRKVQLTAIANPANSESETTLVMDVLNPLVFRMLTDDQGNETPIASDISAPIAWFGNNTPHLNYEAFLRPDRMRRDGQLTMLEPYQRGKIPLILVHGLASDPLTWSGLVNELRATDWFNEHYQIWVFGYATGRPFLRSAAELRKQCAQAVTVLTNGKPDPAMHQAVMIGHSMGGLVAKLQVADSENELWTTFANRPLESLRTDESTRRYLSELFFFRPSPLVKRVVFIGTPHHGSPIAEEWIGKLASKLVVRSHDFSDEYETFLAQNPGVITSFFSERIPTSVDMLRPRDPVLRVIQRLPVPQHVRLHSVIGNRRRMLVGRPTDGAVPVDSARHEPVDSELFVATTHRRLQSHPDTVQEVLRILELHLQESNANGF